MEKSQKFANSKEVITFLAETFPASFSLSGDAKPLKIGIFQDIVEQLKDEERLSKTLLRSTLRHYTNSWRYLHAVKEGAFRVNLDGSHDAAIEKEHAEHAQMQLQESKAKVAEKRKEQAAKKEPANKTYKNKASSASKTTINGTNTDKPKPNKRPPPPEKLTDESLKVGTLVTVKVGKEPMPATITDISKDGVQVQLDTGMMVKVQVDNLRLVRSKR